MGFIRYAGGKLNITAPSPGIPASDLAIGSSVYLMENGIAAEYLVVNHGVPSSSNLYDASCDGLWLLRKDCYETRQWHSSNTNVLESSAIHSYLNSTYFNLFGELEQAAIKQVKIPYRANGGLNGTDKSGTNGLSTKVFLLSVYELGFTSSNGLNVNTDGAKLDYFDSGTGTSAAAKRIAYMNNTKTWWWLRSLATNSRYQAAIISTNGSCSTGSVNGNCSNSQGIRPTIILPNTAVFDSNTLVLKEVA